MFCPPGNLQQQNAALNEAKSNYLAPKLSLRSLLDAEAQYSGLVEDLALTVPAGSCASRALT